MKGIARFWPLSLYAAGVGTGVFMGQSWLNTLAVFAGWIMVAIFLPLKFRHERRKKMEAARAPLTRLLDRMISVVETSDKPLVEFVIYNAERARDSTVIYALQLRGGSATYHLQTETISTGKHAGWMKARVAVHAEDEKRSAVDYPEIVGWTAPEPWLMDRIKKLRDLVGTASAYHARKDRLAQLGINI